MKKSHLLTMLILIAGMRQIQSGVCPGVEGLDSPVNVLNAFVDEFFNVYDERSKGDEIQTLQVVSDGTGERYKMLFQVIDRNEGVIKYYTGVSSVVRIVKGKKRHVVNKFIQSDDIQEVIRVVGISFKDMGNLSCKQTKKDFLTYYLNNKTVIEYFVHYFDIENVQVKQLLIKEEDSTALADNSVQNLREELVLLEKSRQEEVKDLNNKFTLEISKKDSDIEELKKALEISKADREGYKERISVLENQLDQLREANKEEIEKKLNKQKEEYEDRIDSLDKQKEEELKNFFF